MLSSESTNVTVPGGFIDVRQAEVWRQDATADAFRQRCPEVFQRAVDAIATLKMAEQEVAESRAAVVSASTSVQSGDIMDAARRAAMLVLGTPQAQAQYGAKTISAPTGVPVGSKSTTRKASVRDPGSSSSRIVDTGETVPAIR